MYDELIQSLRCCADDLNLCYTCKFRDKYVDSCDEILKNEAADAIEELSKQILEMGQVGKFLLDVHKINSKMVAPESVPTDSEWWSHYKALLELLYLPRWIPVTDRLPPAEKEVYVTDGEYIARANLLDDLFPGDKPCWSYSGLGEITY